MSSLRDGPRASVCAGIGVVAVGARLSTVTAKLWRADRPPGSMTVTVRVASPVTPARTVSVVPLADAVATRLLLDAISTCSASPSGSLKWRTRSSAAVSRL